MYTPKENMMKNAIKLLSVSLLLLGYSTAHAQNLLKKIKQKAEQTAEKVVDKKIDKAVEDQTGISNENTSTPSPSAKNSPGNKGGAGLVTTPPDVNQNLSDAEAAFKANNYGEARYAVQQAMLGVEMQIGKKILAGLPESVSGLKISKEDDKVTSTGWGWVGLTIQRKYAEGDKQLTTTIANNSVWMSAVNLYLANGGYAQTSSDNQKWKQTKVKGNKALIEFDEGSGYKLTVPIGQTSLIIWEGVNFATEQDIMNAANSFDIDGIKKTLGEK
ncbi:hypothetical protein GZH53_12400 [Flavihumibacter sp. R14]|nr:hypothetical protein [Flavihumibacter soli]